MIKPETAISVSGATYGRLSFTVTYHACGNEWSSRHTRYWNELMRAHRGLDYFVWQSLVVAHE